MNGQLEGKWEFEWLFGFRRVCRSTDERSGIFDLFPLSGAGDSIFLIATKSQSEISHTALLGGLDSFVFDFVTRQKAGGINLNFFIAQQLPVLPPQTYHQPCPWLPISNPQSPISSFLLPRVLELTYTAYDLRPFAEDCGYHGPPFRWDQARRFLLRCELDAAYFHLYGIGREDTAYIMDTFTIVRRKDEAAFGEYRTKRVILEMYDEMAAAMENRGLEIGDWEPYQTRLEPPPAHPDAAHPWDEAYLGPELPREQWWAIADNRLKDEGGRMKDEGGGQTVREAAPQWELKSAAADKPRPKAPPKPALDVQPALVTEFAPPQGGYGQRLKRVMALGQPKNQMELTELIAALGDEQGQIRWLAGASLVKVGGTAVVRLLAAYLETKPGDTARAEAARVLEMIAETDEDEVMRAAAKEAGQ